MSRLIFNKFLSADYEGIKQGRLKFYNWTQPWKLGGKIAPTWKDIILHGNTALTLVNSKANGLNYLKLFGGCENVAETYIDTATAEGKCVQATDPTPTTPVDIVCNNGTISYDSVNNTITVTGTTETITDADGNTATCEYLLSIEDDADTQEIISGTVTRNIGYKVFRGDESFGSSSAYGRALYINAASATWGANRTKAVLCTHFLGKPTATSQQPLYSCFFNSSGHFYIKTEETATDFKTWLAEQYANGTPLILFFVKSSGTTETVTGQVLNKTPLTVTGALNDLVVTPVTSSHTTPTPTQPLQINCNNGVVRLSPNLFKVSDITTSTVSDVTVSASSDGTITVNGTSSSSNYSQFVYPLSNPITEGTYTVSLYNSDTLANSSLVGLAINTTVGGRGVSLTTANNVKTITVNSGETCNNIIIRIAGTANNFKFKIQIEKGDEETPYHNYGEVYANGTVETVEVTGANLANMTADNIAVNQVINDNGNITNSTNNYYYSSYIAIVPNTSYVLYGRAKSDNTLSTYNRICWYDKNQNFISRASYTVNTIGKATSPANARYARFSASCFNSITKITLEDILSFNWTFAQATQEIPYEPYYNGGSATAERLLKVGTYQDIQSVLDGQVTRNVGVKILDGTENWAGAGSGASGNYLVAMRKSEFSSDIDTSANYNSFLCSHLKMGNNDAENTLSITNSTYGVRLGLNTGITGNVSTKVANAKKWLADQYNAGNPVIVVYPLATPTTETVTGQPLTIQAGSNVVEITQASMDDLELEVSYKAGVQVTVTEIENAQLDNSVEVTVNG